MNASKSTSTLRLLAACSLGVSLAGCSILKPSGVTPRSFVLTSLPAPSATSSQSTAGPTVGMGYVTIPAYLSGKSMAMRQQTNEVVYLDNTVWAERLDLGLQRVLAADLGALTPTDRVRLSVWRTEEVTAEVRVSVERFDVNSRGEAQLVAWWRVNSPGGEKLIASGKFSATRNGTSPQTDPQGAVASMSALAADLAQELARAIKGNGP